MTGQTGFSVACEAPPRQALHDYSRVPRPAIATAESPPILLAGDRGARDNQRVGAAISAGLKPRPFGSQIRL